MSLGVFFPLLLAACGGPAESSPVLPTAVPNIPTAAPTVVPTVNFTDQNWGAAASDPAKYTGSPVHLTGQVFNVEADDTRVGMQIWTDPLRGEGNTVVVFPKQGFPSVAKGDQVEVIGTVVGEFEGKNDAGEALKLPRVEATTVNVVTKGSGASVAAVPAAPASGVAAGATAVPKPSASGAPTATPAVIVAGVYQVKGAEPTGLAIRRGPAVNQAKLGVVHDGGNVQVVAQAAPGWAQVKGDGFSGYASRLYLIGPMTESAALAKLAAS